MKASSGYAPNEIETNVLLLLARLGRLLARHLQGAWNNACTINGVNRSLKKLVTAGLISYVNYYEPRTRKKNQSYQPWRPRGRMYSLTDAGWVYLRHAFPQLEETNERLAPTYFNPRHQAEHQIEYADLVMSVIDQLDQIPGIVGISSYIEMDLGPHSRPRADGILVLRRWNNATLPHLEQSSLFPWLILPRQPHQSDHVVAIEIDRGTEEIRILEEKARSYRDVFVSQYWKGKYQFPLVAFAVPTERRKISILDAWERGWPGSVVMGTTFEQVHREGAFAPIWTLQRTVQGQRTQETYSFLPRAWRDLVLPEKGVKAE